MEAGHADTLEPDLARRVSADGQWSAIKGECLYACH